MAQAKDGKVVCQAGSDVVATPKISGSCNDRVVFIGGNSRAQEYTPEQKDQFFSVPDRPGSVSAAARVFGLNQMTCHPRSEPSRV